MSIKIQCNCVPLFWQGIDSVFEQIVFTYTTLGKGLGQGPVFKFQSDSMAVSAVCKGQGGLLSIKLLEKTGQL